MFLANTCCSKGLKIYKACYTQIVFESSIKEFSLYSTSTYVITCFIDQNSEELKDYLREGPDYALLPEEAWNLLIDWYGLSIHSKPIMRYLAYYQVYVTIVHNC